MLLFGVISTVEIEGVEVKAYEITRAAAADGTPDITTISLETW
jgi:hypothetical protein